MKTLKELIPPSEILAAKVPLEARVCGLAESSADVKSGELFFAVKGSHADGHAFVHEVEAKRACAVVVENREAFDASERGVWVASTRAALGRAASRWYEEPSRAFKLVGVTGTNGKTTTTFLLKEVWQALGFTTGTIGTVEYQMGDETLAAPLTTPGSRELQSLLARMRNKAVTHASMEVSSIALDQERVAGCRFEVAVFTNLTPDHLDYHGTMEKYFEAKRRLFLEYAPRFSVINTEDPAGKLLSAQVRNAITYSTQDSGADFYALSKEFSGGGIRAKVSTPSGVIELRSPLIGAHNLSNCMGVLTVAHVLGEDLAQVAQALSKSLGAPGRLEPVAAASGRPYVFVDYAHSEDALKNVLESLRGVRGKGPGRIVTVFGCGGDRDRAKRPRMARVACQLSDVVVATSDNPRTEDPDAILDQVEKGVTKGSCYYRQSDRRIAIRQALELAAPGDFVLVAGKGHETYQIRGVEKVPFDDRRVVRDYYDDV